MSSPLNFETVWQSAICVIRRATNKMDGCGIPVRLQHTLDCKVGGGGGGGGGGGVQVIQKHKHNKFRDYILTQVVTSERTRCERDMQTCKQVTQAYELTG